MSAFSITAASSRAHLIRCVLCLCSLILLFQLTVAVAHHHDAPDDLAQCVVCHLGGKLDATIPAPSSELLAIFLVIAYLVARRPDYVSIVPLRYLTPSSQAPPAQFSL